MRAMLRAPVFAIQLDTQYADYQYKHHNRHHHRHHFNDNIHILLTILQIASEEDVE